MQKGVKITRIPMFIQMCENSELLPYMQHLTASVVSILELIQKSCNNLDKTKLHEKHASAIDRLLSAVQKFLYGVKNQDDDFDYSRFIKKVYYSLRNEDALTMLKNKNTDLFAMRDENNKIITILPGIDIRLAMTHMTDEHINAFWPHFYLFTASAFTIVHKTNKNKEAIMTDVLETIEYLNKEIQKTGILVGDSIFNPFVGLNSDVPTSEFTIEKLFSGNVPEVVTGNGSGIETMLSTLGVEKLLDPSKLKEQLENIGDDQICEATDKIIEMLGAQNNDDVKEVCGTLIKDIVDNLKQNGLSNIGESLMDIANQTKQKVNIDKMKKTAMSMQNFMNSSSETMMNIKDEKGNPIGQNLMNIMTSCMSQLPKNSCA